MFLFHFLKILYDKKSYSIKNIDTSIKFLNNTIHSIKILK